MNRKQRRALAKQNRKRQNKLKKVEDRMGTDFETVKILASQLEGIQTKVQIIHQAIQEIPTEELDGVKMLEDLDGLKDQLSGIREQGKTMGPAVQGALEEAIEKAVEAMVELKASLEDRSAE